MTHTHIVLLFFIFLFASQLLMRSQENLLVNTNLFFFFVLLHKIPMICLNIASDVSFSKFCFFQLLRRIKDYCLITFHEKIISITSISTHSFACAIRFGCVGWWEWMITRYHESERTRVRERERDMIKRFGRILLLLGSFFYYFFVILFIMPSNLLTSQRFLIQFLV